MKRWMVTMALLAGAFAGGAAQAGEKHKLKHPPRYRYGSYGVWVKTNAPGYPAYRYTYRGASSNFPPPAHLYYGYPHSGDGTGPGF